MQPKLSIIIPCYNCKKTVEEAVESCYTKSLNNFEIIMVDDGSTDNTRIILQKLSEKYKEIKVVYHEKNRGGGAARNTGIKNSSGEYIYCLDSDNVLGENMLSKCLSFIKKYTYDGVAVYERKFFSNNINYLTGVYRNSILNRQLTLHDLFDKKNDIMIDNFLYTKKAYNRTRGYPEHHGFDTQSFEIGFLFANNSIHVCPDTFSYHRQAKFGETTYFEREFNKGNFSINYYLIAEDIITKLSDTAINAIINFNIFENNSLNNNLLTMFNNLAKKNDLFKDGNNQKNENFIIKAFIKAIGSYKNKDFQNSEKNLINICNIYKKTEVLEYLLERNRIMLQNNNISERDMEQKLNLWININKKMPSYKLYKWYHKIPYISDLINVYIKWKGKNYQQKEL